MQQEQLLQVAREQHRTGDLRAALRTCAELVDRAHATGNPLLLAEAATLVRRPLDPLLRAQAHALAAEALVHLDGLPTLQAGVRDQLLATRNPFTRPPDNYDGTAQTSKPPSCSCRPDQRCCRPHALPVSVQMWPGAPWHWGMPAATPSTSAGGGPG